VDRTGEINLGNIHFGLKYEFFKEEPSIMVSTQPNPVLIDFLSDSNFAPCENQKYYQKEKRSFLKQGTPFFYTLFQIMGLMNMK
jgi:hypothetical protein